MSQLPAWLRAELPELSPFADKQRTVPRLLDLRFCEPMVVQETQTVCCYLDERWRLPHRFSIASPSPDSRGTSLQSP
jgi:hypothetical protein